MKTKIFKTKLTDSASSIMLVVAVVDSLNVVNVGYLFAEFPNTIRPSLIDCNEAWVKVAHKVYKWVIIKGYTLGSY